VRNARLWEKLLGVNGTVVENVVHDRGEGRRRWRALDLGTVPTWLEADAPRVNCPEHGVVVASVPWARHGAGHTRGFDDMAAWLATHCAKSAVEELMRVAWRTVGSIVTRVAADARAATDPLDKLVRIGIDEISYKKGHKYLVVVVDHDTGKLVWAKPGRDKKTLGAFFDALGEERCRQIRLVSADGAGWIATVVADRCKNATRCMDPFHVVQWCTDALDEVRREVWNAARNGGMKTLAGDLKGARFALWKNPEDLTANQEARLSWVQATNQRLYRAYLLKEQLRQVFKLRGDAGIALLKVWLAWASRSKLEAFVELARSIRNHRAAIEAALVHGLTNARVESVNTKIRLLQRVAFGYRDPEALIAMAMLDLGGCCPDLPGRAAA
jgi:transposase